ncbi:MAG: acyltransferase [Candidatus Altiarchaeales archaeon]|nr:acyltransferase [Candidatus Altiarchaeales archaeon]
MSKLLRVIPIYWLALAVGIFIFKERHSIMEFATIKSVSIFWFISAIVHCYLLAPLLYYTLRKLKTTQYLLVISLSFFVLNFTFYSGSFQGTTANYLNKISALDYRGLFLSHILLFGLGMAVPLLNWKHKLIQKCNEYCLLIVLFVLVDQTRGSSVNKLTSVAFIFGSAVVFSFFMHRKNRLVFTRILSFMGKYAYSIYLFHLFFYIKLSSLGIIQYNSIQSVLRTIALLPILFILCALVEKTFSKISDCIKHLTNRVIGI